MTYELMAVLKEIDLALMDYSVLDKKNTSIFAISEMAFPDYKEKKQNVYKLIIIRDELTNEDFLDIIEFMNNIARKGRIASYHLSSSNLETTKDFKVAEDVKKVFLQVEVFSEQEFIKLLSPTLKHQYAKRYRLISGFDYLKEYQKDALSFEEIEDDIANFKREIELKMNTCSSDLDLLTCNNLLTLIPVFFNNLWNYCKCNGYNIPNDKMIFLIRLLGQNYCTNETLFLLHGLLMPSSDLLKEMFTQPFKELLLLFDRLEKRVAEISSIFSLTKSFSKIEPKIYE